uniref:Uncharacterized protein n=1 Tax=Physcomitrium patens TaxID=3218 RepID=A0A2K1J286_PHYPA|nr:hypothetical protein PHYPA_021486 [Physcomitrium patens]
MDVPNHLWRQWERRAQGGGWVSEESTDTAGEETNRGICGKGGGEEEKISAEEEEEDEEGSKQARKEVNCRQLQDTQREKAKASEETRSWFSLDDMAWHGWFVESSLPPAPVRHHNAGQARDVRAGGGVWDHGKNGDCVPPRTEPARTTGGAGRGGMNPSCPHVPFHTPLPPNACWFRGEYAPSTTMTTNANFFHLS